MPSDDDIPFINRQRLKWDNRDLLGEGSFGRVFRGQLHGTPVAIKVVKRANNNTGDNDNITPEQRQQELAALKQHRREIHRFKEFVNPHIIQYLGVFRDQDPRDLYIVTEYLEGGSLYDSLERMRARRAILDDFSFLQIALHIAYGLNHVHSEKYTHGDIKPQNILLTAKFTFTETGPNQFLAFLPPSAKVKIADFGLSKRLKGARETAAQNNNGTVGAGTTEFGPGPCGTLLYMSPEGYRGVRNLDDSQAMASDIYAYGLVLFELLSGLQSWQLEKVTHPLHIASLVSSRKRPSWGGHKEFINRRYVKLVEDCWSQEYEDRPTASDVLELLNELHHEFTNSRQNKNQAALSGMASSPRDDDEQITSIDAPEADFSMAQQNEAQNVEAQTKPQPGVRKPDTPFLEIPSTIKKPETPQLLIPPFQPKQADPKPNPQNIPDPVQQHVRQQNEQPPQSQQQPAAQDMSDDAQFAQFLPQPQPATVGAQQSPGNQKPDAPPLLGALNGFVDGLPDGTTVPGYQGRDYNAEYESTFDYGNFQTYEVNDTEVVPNALPGMGNAGAGNQPPNNIQYQSNQPPPANTAPISNNANVKKPVGHPEYDTPEEEGGVIAVLVESININQDGQKDPTTEQKQPLPQPQPMAEPDENDTVDKAIMIGSNAEFPPPLLRKVISKPFVSPANAAPQMQNLYGVGGPIADASGDNRDGRSNTKKLDSFIKAADPMQPVATRDGQPFVNPQLELAQAQQLQQPIKPETPMLSLTALQPPEQAAGQVFAPRPPQGNPNASVGQLMGLPPRNPQQQQLRLQQQQQQQQLQLLQAQHQQNQHVRNMPGVRNPALPNADPSQLAEGGKVSGQAPPITLSQFMDPNHVAPQKVAEQPMIVPGQQPMVQNVHQQLPQQEPPYPQQHPQMLREPPIEEPNHIEATLKTPNGWTSVTHLWESGQCRNVAKGLAQYRALHGKDSLYRVSEFLRTSLTKVELRRDKELAKDLCTTLGNIARTIMDGVRYEHNPNDSSDRKSSELSGIDNATLRHALTVTLQCMYTFTRSVDVYAECSYALCHLLQIDNNVTDQALRQHLATWLNHCIVWNVSDVNHVHQPERDVLAYASISAVRNFIWFNEANVQTILQDPNNTMISPLGNIIKTAYDYDSVGRTAIVETCMSTLAVAIQYPVSRIAFAQQQGLKLVTHIVNRYIESPGYVQIVKVSLHMFTSMVMPLRPDSSNDQLTVDTITKAVIESDCARAIVRAIYIARSRQLKLASNNAYAPPNPSGVSSDSLDPNEDRQLSQVMHAGLQAIVVGLRFNHNVAHAYAESDIAKLAVRMLNELIHFIRTNGHTEIRQQIAVALCDIVASLCRDGAMLRQMRQAGVHQLVKELHDGSTATEGAIQACQAALQVNVIPAYG